jgi:hypothetical protein
VVIVFIIYWNHVFEILVWLCINWIKFWSIRF